MKFVPASDRTRKSAAALWTFALTLILGTIFSWTVYFASHRDPLFRPIFQRADRLHDLINYRDKMRNLTGNAEELGKGLPVFNYPPPAVLPYKFFFLARSHAAKFLIATILCFVCLCGHVLFPRIRAGGSAAIAAGIALFLFSSPLAFALDRGNMELVVWMFTTGFIICFLAKRQFSAAVLLGLAIAIKPFPALLLVLFLSRKMWKEAGISIAVAVSLFVGVLVWLGPNPVHAYQKLTPGVAVYVDRYMHVPLPADEARFCHSLLDTMKLATLSTQVRPGDSTAVDYLRTYSLDHGGWAPAFTLIRIYKLLAAVLALLILARSWKLPALSQLVALTISMTLLPPIAAEYTLLHLSTVAAVLLWSLASGPPEDLERPGMTQAWWMALLGAVLTPLTFFGAFAGSAKTLILVMLLAVALRWPLPSRTLDANI